MADVRAQRAVRARRGAPVGAPAAPARRRPARRRSLAWWAAGGALLALALRLPYAGVALGVDEGGVAYIAGQWATGEGSLYGAHWLDRPPLLLALFALAAPGGEAGVRALGAVFAVALVLLVTATAREVAGDRAGRVAAVLAGALAGSVAIMATTTAAELLAAVPATAAVLALLRARRGGGERWLALAGAGAGTALLVKQSAVDAAAAGAVFAALAGGIRGLAVLAAGAAAPWALAVGALAVTGHPVAELPYALVGFRLAALDALSGAGPPFEDRLARLAAPALGSALVLVLPLAVAGVRRVRRDRVLALTLGAWLAAGTAGVLAGGSYWAHYLIQLVPAGSVLAAVALAHLRPRARVAATAVVAGVVVLVNAAGLARVRERPPHALEQAAVAHVRAHARPGDTQHVLHARANVLHGVGLPSPFPYHWSLMLRTIPGATERLRAVLDSEGRPTWVLQWQGTDDWGLDPRGRTRAVLERRYRRVTPWLCGRSVHVWLRRDDRRAVGPPRACPPFGPRRAG